MVDQGSGTIRGRAIFPNPDGLITPGQFGRIRIPGSPEYDALLIPDAAIVTDQSRKVVLTVQRRQRGRAQDHPARARASPAACASCAAASTPEDRIVINGLLRARRARAAEGGTLEGRRDRARAHRARGRLTDALLALLRRPADLRGGDLDRHHADRRPSPTTRCRSPSTRRWRRRRSGHRQLPRRLGRGRGRDRGDAARAGDQRRREHALHGLARRRPTASVRSPSPSRSAPTSTTAQVLVQNRVTIAEPQLPEEVRRARRHDREELARPDDGDPPQLAGRVARPALHLQLRARCRSGTCSRACTASATSRLFGARDYSMRIWLDPDRLAELDLTADRRGGRGRGPERPGRLRQPQPAAGARTRAPSSSASRRWAGSRTCASSRTSSSRPTPTAGSRASATSPGSSWAPQDYCATPTSTTARRWRWASSSSRARTRWRPRPTC